MQEQRERFRQLIGLVVGLLSWGAGNLALAQGAYGDSSQTRVDLDGGIYERQVTQTGFGTGASREQACQQALGNIEAKTGTACGSRYSSEVANVQAGSCQCSQTYQIGGAAHWSCNVPIKVYCRKSSQAIERERRAELERETAQRSRREIEQNAERLDDAIRNYRTPGADIGTCQIGDERCAASGYVRECRRPYSGAAPEWRTTSRQCH